MSDEAVEQFDDDGDEKDNDISVTIHPGTYLRRPRQNTHTVIPEGTAAVVDDAPPSTSLSAPSSPRNRHHNHHRTSTGTLVVPSSSSARVTLDDLQHHELTLPDRIEEPVLVDLLTEVERFVLSLSSTDTTTLDDLAKKWLSTRNRMYNSECTVTPFNVNMEYERLCFMVARLRLKFFEAELVQQSGPNESAVSYTYMTRFARIFNLLFDTRTILISHARVKEYTDPNTRYEIGQFQDYINPGYFTYLKTNELTSFQRFLLFTLNEASKRNFRKRWQEFPKVGETVCLYEQVFTPEGHPTHAWNKTSCIDHFVHTLIHPDTNFDQWNDYTRVRGMLSNIIAYVKISDDIRLPELKRQRDKFAFRNGIYDASKRNFFTYNHPLPSSVVCARYFSQDFDLSILTIENPMDIPTPPLDKIFDDQGLPTDAKFVIMALFGRHFHDLNKLEQWRVALFVLGLPGTGKSTLAEYLLKLFDEEDIGIMSSDMEKQFGVSAFADAFVAVCSEVSERFQLTHTMLQSMIDGEWVSFARKYMKATKMKWAAHCLFFANVIPPHWNEYGGNLLRRFVCVMFTNMIINMVSDLEAQFREYLGNILHKLNLCYHHLVKEWGRESFWDEKRTPKYFYETKERLATMISPIQAFIQLSGWVETTSDFNHTVKQEDFLGALNMFCKSRGYNAKKWTSQLCLPTFKKFGIVDDGFKLHNIRFTPDYIQQQLQQRGGGGGFSHSHSAPVLTIEDD